MPQLLHKTFRLIFWAIAPFLFVSSGVDNTHVDDISLIEGMYLFKTSGDFKKQLKGQVVFETYLETSMSGKKFSTLKLSFKNEENTPFHMLEFIISEPNNESVVATGPYTIIPKIDGFLKCFNGAFGFADIIDLGEVPFFARKGKIVIGEVEKGTIRGILSANLHGPNGKKIFVSGNFSAVRKD